MADPAYIVDGVLTDGEAWVGLGTTTLGSDTATITFTSTDDGQVGDFSQYMDLMVVWYARSAKAATGEGYLGMRYNNNSGAIYGQQFLTGDGSSASAGESSGPTYTFLGFIPNNNVTANIFASGVCSIFDINSGKYTSSIAQLAEDMDGSGRVRLEAVTWRNQAPISEIDVFEVYGENMLAGSQVSLFGILPRMVA
jgi:hypothetical protein